VGDNTGSGVRRILENRSVQCEGLNCPRYAQVLDGEFMGSSGTCQGDSGGPALDEQGRVLGALSRGAGQCQTSTYSAVAGKWADWVIEVGGIAAERGGYEPPFWVEHEVSEIPEDDIDLDGVITGTDNCPETFNEDQSDVDEDGIGDACDDHSDADEIADDEDNCPLVDNPDQLDTDGDGFGDACDQDDDEDGIEDDADFCPQDENFSDYGDPCGTDPDTTIVVLQDENSGGCQKSSTASGAPTGVAGGLLLVLGMMLRRRRRS
jgi:MYXO-CTERM domain-containing protein